MGKLILGRFGKLPMRQNEYVPRPKPAPVLHLIRQETRPAGATCITCQSEIAGGHCRRCADFRRFRHAHVSKLRQALELMGTRDKRSEDLLARFHLQETFDGVIAFLLTDISPLTGDLPLTAKIKKASELISLLIERFDERKRVPYAVLS